MLMFVLINGLINVQTNTILCYALLCALPLKIFTHIMF